MHINSVNTAPGIRRKFTNIQKNVANTFANIIHFGEGASIAFDFLGKAVVVPAIIMVSSDEPKEKKEYSAFKNPVAAVIQLALEVPILFFGSKAIEKGANKGIFDKGVNRQYNEKFYKDIFVSNMEKSFEDTKKAEEAKNLIEKINKKGLGRKITENIDDFIANSPKQSRDLLKKSFKEYKNAHKKLFHLQNRLCFAAAILLTPLICALENKFHPIIMDKIYEEEGKMEKAKGLKDKKLNNQNNMPAFKPNLSMDNFIKQTRNNGIKA